jgi:hypothetical protein
MTPEETIARVLAEHLHRDWDRQPREVREMWVERYLGVAGDVWAMLQADGHV